MIEINLAPIPDQTLSITQAQTLYDLRIFLAANVMCCDLSINSVPVVTSMRIVSGMFIIPYWYLQNGNFLISTLDGDLPYYDQFGVTQFLTYASQAEAEAFLNG